MFAVNQRVSAWDNDSSFILYEYEIVNNSLSRVNHLNAGLYLDWSVGNPLINLAYVDTLKQYGTVYSVDKTLPYCGAKLLTHSRVNQFIIESADESDPRIVASNGISNTELVYAMTHQKSKMNVSKYLGTGITQIINIKDVSLEVNDTLRFAAILFATDREEHIISILERATLHYQNTVATVNEQGNDTAFEVSILPTIVSTEMVEALLVTPVEGLATVDLVDGTGVLLSRRGVNVSRGHNKLRIPLPSTPGYYVLRCSQGSNYRSQVLVKQ
jgi:hypothetical protein